MMELSGSQPLRAMTNYSLSTFYCQELNKGEKVKRRRSVCVAVGGWGGGFTLRLRLITALLFVNDSINGLVDWPATFARLPDETAKRRAKPANPLYT